MAISWQTRPREKLPQCLESVIGGLGKARLFIAQLRDVARLHRRVPEGAGALAIDAPLADRLQDPAPGFPRAFVERLKNGRGVIPHSQPSVPGIQTVCWLADGSFTSPLKAR